MHRAFNFQWRAAAALLILGRAAISSRDPRIQSARLIRCSNRFGETFHFPSVRMSIKWFSRAGEDLNARFSPKRALIKADCFLIGHIESY